MRLSRRRVELDPQGLGQPFRRVRVRPAGPHGERGSHGASTPTSAELLGSGLPWPRRRAAHAARLIRLSGDVTPQGRARSASRSHCSGGSRSAHSRSQRNRGPARRPARPGARSSGKPERASALAPAPAQPPPPGQGQVCGLRPAPAQLRSGGQVSQSALSDC